MFKWWWRLVRFGFRLLYNEMAFTYDLVSKVVSFGQWRCWQRAGLKHLNVSGGAKVLELAHGTGDLQLDLKLAGHKTIGFDLSPYMGRITQRKLKSNRLSSELVRGKAQQLPFMDNAFDAIICTFPTPFVFERETLLEAYRVLKADGRFVIVINGVFTRRGLVTRLLQGLYRITGQQADEQADDDSFARLGDLFRQAGFEVRLVREPCSGSYAQVIVASANGEFTSF